MSDDVAGRRGTSQSLERGLAILSQFSTDRRLIGVSEVAKELGLTRSTAHRYITTLARLGYLHRDPASRKYNLGPRVHDLGLTAINSMELRDVAAPHLRQLCDETGNTVNMAILDDVDIVYVERFRAFRRHQNEIDLDLHVGLAAPRVLHVDGEGAARLPRRCRAGRAREPDQVRRAAARTRSRRRRPYSRNSSTSVARALR